MTCDATVYDATGPNGTSALGQKQLRQTVSKDPTLNEYVPTGHIVTQVQPQTQQDGTVLLSVTAKGVWYYQWTKANQQALLDNIKGKSKAQTQAILNSYLGIAHATIDIGNGGSTMPSDASQITLVVKPVTGL
jgi:hypothetical protein